MVSFMCQETVDYQMNWLALLGTIVSETSVDGMIVSLGLRPHNGRSSYNQNNPAKVKRDGKIMELRATGMAFRAISKELNCPVTTVQEVYRRLR